MAEYGHEPTNAGFTTERLHAACDRRIQSLEAKVERHAEIIERVMTSHWDMKACECWLCEEGRLLGCRPRGDYLHDKTRPTLTPKPGEKEK